MSVIKSRVSSSIDLDQMGCQFGELMIPWSDNTVPLGHHPIPIINMKNGNGKKLLIIGGNHGDEFGRLFISFKRGWIKYAAGNRRRNSRR